MNIAKHIEIQERRTRIAANLFIFAVLIVGAAYAVSY